MHKSLVWTKDTFSWNNWCIYEVSPPFLLQAILPFFNVRAQKHHMLPRIAGLGLKGKIKSAILNVNVANLQFSMYNIENI